MIYLLFFLCGASLASFLQLISYRRSQKEQWIQGRSHCDFCGKNLSVVARIPIFHYFILKGKSQCCGKKLEKKYPIIEFLGGLLSILLFYKIGEISFLFWFIGGFYFLFLFLALEDISTMEVYIRDLVFLFFMALLCRIILGSFSIVSFALVSVACFAFHFIKKNSFGMGDSALLSILSLFHNSFIEFLWVVALGFGMASLYGGFLLFQKKGSRKTKIPLFPFLLLGSLVSFLLFY